MKLIRFGSFRNEKPGVILANGTKRDCSGWFEDWNSVFFANDGLARLQAVLDKEADTLPLIPKDARLGSCVARPYKVLCIGLNYSDHAAESGLDVPTEPVLFQKSTNTVVGPNDNVEIPRNALKTDWEVELGVIIGKEARYLNSAEESSEYIAGYCISNDVSERAFQIEHGGQWTKGKCCDTFNPLGPFLATPDEIADVNNLSMTLDVNGEKRQQGTTATMIFDVNYIVHYVSQYMTLEPGDVISTGTPPGVGLGMTPPQYLKKGDVMELSIEGLGSQKQTCI